MTSVGSDDVCECGHTRYIHSAEYGCEASQYAPAFCSCQQFKQRS